MNRILRTLLLAFLMLPASRAHAGQSFVISPSVGSASISNLDGYGNSPVLRLDGTYHPIPEFGANVFVAGYPGFDSGSAGNRVTVKVAGFGAGVTGRWPLHPRVQPYARLDYMLWSAKASGFGRTLAEDDGGSAGLALGAQFPITRIIGIKAELSGYNNVSGANIRQLSVGVKIEL